MSRFPTATQVLRKFAPLERHEILSGAKAVRTIHPVLTSLQKEVLRLLGVPQRCYRMTT